MKLTKDYLRSLIRESLEEGAPLNNTQSILLAMFGKGPNDSVEAGDPINAEAFKKNVGALENAMKSDKGALQTIGSFFPYINSAFNFPNKDDITDKMESLLQPYMPKKGEALKPIPQNVISQYIKLFKSAVSAESKIPNEPEKPSSFKDMAQQAAVSYQDKQGAKYAADSDAALDAMSKLEENKIRLKLKVK